MTKHLLSGHAHFRAEYFVREESFLRDLAENGQTPSALYIGCSDSRVIPELLTAAAPGELFVVRNVANLVPTFENGMVSVGAAIEYAVAKLRVQHLILCGHYGCGGIRATLDGLDTVADLPTLHTWLHGALPAAQRARAIITGDDDELFRVAVEENVLEQMDNIITYPAMERALARKELVLHGWIYDIGDAQLHVYDAEQEEFVGVSKP